MSDGDAQEKEAGDLWPLPEGWCWTTLGQLGIWTGGGTPAKSNKAFWSNGTVPWVSPKDMKSDIIGETQDLITEAAVAGSSAKLIGRSSVLMVMRSGILRHSFPVGVTDRQVTVNQDLRALTPHNSIDANFVARYLRLSVKRVLEDCSKDGTTVDSIEASRLEGFPVPLAPPAEQKRIVEKIDALFAEIEDGEAALSEAKTGLEIFQRSLLKAAVTGELTRDWRQANTPQETGHDLLARIKAERAAQASVKGQRKRKQEYSPIDPTELPDIPDTWAWAYPDDLTAISKNALAIGPFGSNLKVSDYQESGVPLIFVRHIRNQRFSEDNPKFISSIKASELQSHTVRPGDILVTKMGDPPGDACIYPDDAPMAVITADCIKFTVSQGIEYKSLFVYFLMSCYGKRQIADRTTGVAQLKVSLDRFKNIAFPVPPLSEGNELVRRVYEALIYVGDATAVVEAEAANAARLKQAVLKAAFEGKLVAQDPDDEPASVVLERIVGSASTIDPKRRPRRTRTKA